MDVPPRCTKRRFGAGAALVALLLPALSACGTSTSTTADPPAFDPPPIDVWGVTATGTLVRFHIADPATIQESVTLSGLAAGDTLVALTNRGDYALGRQSRLYRLDLGAGTLAEEPGMPFAPPLAGDCFDLDGNVILPGLLAVMEGGKRQEATAGTTLPAISYATGDENEGRAPDLAGFVGEMTVGYFVDVANDVLATLDIGFEDPADDTLHTLGALGVDVDGSAGLAYGEYYDPLVAAVPGSAKKTLSSWTPPSPVPGLFLVATPPGATATRIYLVDVASGKAELRATIGGGEPIVDLTFGAGAHGAYPQQREKPKEREVR